MSSVILNKTGSLDYGSLGACSLDHEEQGEKSLRISCIMLMQENIMVTEIHPNWCQILQMYHTSLECIHMSTKCCFISNQSLAYYILCLLLLISMLWHRQAIFELKGVKLSSSAECRIWTQGLWNRISSRLNARWQTNWAIEDQAKTIKLNRSSLWSVSVFEMIFSRKNVVYSDKWFIFQDLNLYVVGQI